ncbi:MAG: Gfo/Idh/MocA family oxidoreductase [Planctomycetota bacterium]
MSVKVAFIGSGNIVEQVHAPILSRMEQVDIVAFSDIVLDKAKNLSEKYDSRAYDNHLKMLDKEKLDAVYICLPTKAHGQVELDVIQSDIPFLVEKPVAGDLETAQKIDSALRSKNIFAASGYMFRYLPIVQKLKQCVNNRKIGLITGYYYTPFIDVPNWYRKEISGGPALEMVTHIYDLALYIGGDVAEVYARSYTGINKAKRQDCTIEDMLAATITFTSGTLGNLQQAHTLPPETVTNGQIHLEAFADGLWGQLTLTLDERELVIKTETLEEQKDDADPYIIQNTTFINAVQTKDLTKIKTPYSDAIESLKLSLAIYDSVKTGQPVKLKK